MTVDIQFGNVITAISQLHINGVAIKDIDEIPENAEMVLPVLFPDPGDLITEVSLERLSYGSGTTAAMNMRYRLHYLYAHAKIGSSLSLSSVMPGLLSNLALILEVMATNDAVNGAVDLDNPQIQIGQIESPNGAKFHGAAISLGVLEHVQ